MTSTTIFIIFIPVLAILLLFINLLLAPHNPYQEKDSPFECGYHSFRGQNRTEFSISFFIFALLFLLFDLEIILMYPYGVSSYNNDIYGLTTMLAFFIVLTVGFIFELGKNALSIESKQTSLSSSKDTPRVDVFIPFHLRSIMLSGVTSYYMDTIRDMRLCKHPKPYIFNNIPLESSIYVFPLLRYFLNRVGGSI